MRLALLAVLLTACLPPLRAVRPDQSTPGDPGSASGEEAGVRVTARPDDWRGWPPDLADHLTPVEVLIENRSGHPVALAAGDFTLVAADGRRLAPLPAAEVRSNLRRAPDFWGEIYYPSAVPGVYRPDPRPGALAWETSPWSGSAGASRPGPTIEDGGRQTLLLVFPVPAAAQERLALEVRPGGGEGKVTLAFAR
jgi:hypothetical protein